MSRDGALARARALRDELVKRGVPVSIEIQQGRPGTPNGGWFDTRFIGSMGHHIVSRRTQGLTPGLALIKRGRTDVPGPLCNGYLGFDGVARIICMGWANHPGAGGPYTLTGGTIPKDAARPYLFGWEIEGGITETDWPASFRIVMGKCHAATLAWLKRDERSHIEHKTWAPTRKIDRLNYTLTKARAELKPFLTVSTPNEEDDLKADEREALLRIDRALTLQSTALVKNPDTGSNNSVRYGVERNWAWGWLNRWTQKVKLNSWGQSRWPDTPEDGYTRDVHLRGSYQWGRRGAEIGEANGREIAFVKAELAGLRNAVQQLVTKPGQPIDLNAVADASLRGAQQALAELEVRITVTPAGEPTGADDS